MQYDVNNDTLILQLNLKKDDDGTVAVQSHRFYPCTILTDLDAADESGAVRTDSYVVAPHSQRYGPSLDSRDYADRDDLYYMEDSLERIMAVYKNRLTFDLPYDPYKLETEVQSEDGVLQLEDFIRGRFHWMAANKPL